MRYAIFTSVGDGLPIAWKLQQEGHDVVAGIVEHMEDVRADGEAGEREDPLAHERRMSLYDGMLEKRTARELVNMLLAVKKPGDWFVFFDRNNLFKFARRLRGKGLKGNFPTEEDYRFEMNRDRAKEFVRKHYPRLEVARVREFATVKEAERFLCTSEDIWVLKGNSDGAKTFVPDVDDSDLAAGQILQALKSGKRSYEREGFILEPLLQNMVEITPERIWYDGVPIATTINVENKPFGSGNVSMQTGCAQDMVFPIDPHDRICEIAFPPAVEQLAKRRKGLFYWDASILIDRRTRKMYFGEFCSNRPGYNCLCTEIAQCPSAHAYFSAITEKRSPFTLGTVGTSVRIFNPATEATSSHPPPDMPVSYKESVTRDLWMWDVRKRGDTIGTAGNDWNLAAITGAGKSIQEAARRMYRHVDDFSFVGAYYRPKFDFLSLDYPSSLLNRLNYGLHRGLYRLPFDVSVGDLL